MKIDEVLKELTQLNQQKKQKPADKTVSFADVTANKLKTARNKEHGQGNVNQKTTQNNSKSKLFCQCYNNYVQCVHGDKCKFSNTKAPTYL